MNSPTRSVSKLKLSLFELLLFSMLGALMFVSKQLLEFLPNIHLLGMFTMVYTIVFRRRALIPIYCFILLEGILAGFNVWWIPYLYLWAVLWGVTMLLPRNMKPAVAMVVYPLVCALHGLCYGTLYAPAQALFFHYNFEKTIAWILAGLPWDAVHAAGNLAAGLLVLPLSNLLRRLYRKIRPEA